MNTQQISFDVGGISNAKRTGAIERTLIQLDGVIAAQVNYAAERTTVVYDPTRVTSLKMVNAIRHIGYDTPVELLTVHSDDLLYATSAQTVEKVLGNIKGVVQVCTDLAGRTLIIEVLPEYAEGDYPGHLLSQLGFRHREGRAIDPRMFFFIRMLLLVGIELFAVWSAGAHAGWWGSSSSLHAPLVTMAASLVALFGTGMPFYRFACDAALQGEFDSSVVIALLASAFAFASLPVGMVSTSPALTDIGFVIATTLTTGWFIARALTLWVFPHFGNAARKANLLSVAPAPWGVLSDGSRR